MIVESSGKVMTIMNTPYTRESLGMFVREMGERPLVEKWYLSVLYSMALELSVTHESNVTLFPHSFIIHMIIYTIQYVIIVL